MRKIRTDYQKRGGASFPIYSREEIAAVIDKAYKGLGSGSPEGYTRDPINAVRDAALVSWEYLSAKRVSEFTGRTYFDDVYAGLTMDHIRFSKRGENDLLQYQIRVLKRSKRKRICQSCQTINPNGNQYCKKCGASLANTELDSQHMKQIWVWKEIDMADPFAKYIVEWFAHLRDVNYQGRIFAISRMQAWRIMNNLGIINHVNRHWRTTHQSRTKTPIELQNMLDRATIPSEYVHSSPDEQLQKTREADKQA